MRKSLKSLLFLGLVWLAAAPSFAQVSQFVQVGGYAYYHLPYDQYQFAPTNSRVKFCVDDGTGRGARGAGECYSGLVGGHIRGNSYYQLGLPANKTYYFFLWNDNDDWGSETTPAWFMPAGGGYATRLTIFNTPLPGDFNIISEPRPHVSKAVYPANGAQNVPLVFMLKWTSGIDAARNWPGGWRVVYDIYAYGEGGSELKVLADIPCNPDLSGNCTYYIDNVVPNWLYYWRVVGKIQVTPGYRMFEMSSPHYTFRTQP